MRFLNVLALALFLLFAPGAFAKGTGGSARAPRSNKCASCARNSKGRIARNSAAVRAFKRSHPCPSTGKSSGPCRGYVVDHVNPLKRGGADDPSNMQWENKAAARAKDRTE